MWVTDAPLAWGRRDPSRPAVVRGQEVVTYGALGGRVRQVAAGVAARTPGGVGRVVAIRDEDPPELLVAFLGVVAAGRVAAPVAAGWTAAETEAALAPCRPALAAGDGPWPAWTVTVPRDGLEGQEGEGAGTTGASDAAFYVGFSSGSTGRPKAVVRGHGAWLKSFLAMTAEFGVGPGTRVAVPGDPFFSFSLIAALQALSVGAAVHLPGARGVPATLDSFEGADAAYLLPSLLDRLARSAARSGRRFPCMRTVVCAGERLRPETRAAAAGIFPHAGIVEYYGASELGFVTVMPPGLAAARPGSVGRAFAGSEVAVLGEDGARMPAGKVGLLCVRNEYGGTYLGQEAGPDPLGHHGWRTVGDLAWQDEEGFVYLAGRWDSMTVIRGENVYPEQVEAVAAAVDGVREVGVVAVPERRPAYLVAVVATDEGVTAEAVLAACRAALSGRKVPRRVCFVDALPRTPAGKLDRAALARLAAREDDSTAGDGDD